MRQMSIQKRRLLCAAAIVALVVFAAPAVEAIRCLSSENGEAALSDDAFGLRTSDILSGNVDAGLNFDRQAAVEYEHEVLSLEGREAVRFFPETGTAGFESALEPEVQYRALEDELVAKGWTSCGSFSQVDDVAAGVGANGTFLRDEGPFTWVFVSCCTISGVCVTTVQAC